MKTVISFVISCLLTLTGTIAQVTVQQGNPIPPDNTPDIGSIYLALLAVGGTALLYLVIYSLSRAIEALSGKVSDKVEFPEREM